MSKLYVIRNHNNYYLTRQDEWLNGSEPAGLFKTPHHDVALNTLIELSAKDFMLRADVLAVPASEKGLPLVDVLAQAQLELETDNIEPDCGTPRADSEKSCCEETTAE